MQGAQTNSRFRGIGRYTLSLTRAMIRQAGEHDIILALNGQFPDSVRTIREHFKGLVPPQNIVVWHAPSVLLQVHVSQGHRQRLAEILREAFLSSLLPDVIHITSLFEGFSDQAVTSLGTLDQTTPVSLIIYDLIPYLNPKQYLSHNKHFEQHYHQKIAYLKKASHLFAISAFAKEEAIQTLNLNSAQITNIFGAIDESLQHIRQEGLPDSSCLKALGINRSFILHTGGGDERKNLPRLIQAFAKLPNVLRQKHQLVFVGRIPEVTLSQLKNEAAEAGLHQGELVFTKFITDAVLARLYCDCSVYVFPSRHEGLGLPAMEAMAFEAPVIVANSSSLPEVVENKDALFDPYDVDDISNKISRVLEDPEFRDALVAHGKKRAQAFSWDESAKRALRAWDGMRCPNQPNRDDWAAIQTAQQAIYKKTINALTGQFASDTSPELIRMVAFCLAHNEREALSTLRPRPLTMPIRWRLEGPFDSSYSLSIVNREVARALVRCGQEVSLHSTEGPGDFQPNPDFLQHNPEFAALHERSLNQSSLEVDVTSRNLYPPRVLDLNSRLNFLHTYGWEESGFPMQWAKEFNTALQGMTVISEHVRKIMIDHGVVVPVSVSGLGVDHWDNITPDHDYRLNAKSFRFLHVSSGLPRKGIDTMLRAYGQAFSADDDVSLIIKTFDNPHNEVHRWLEQARGSRVDFPDVIILMEDLCEAQLKALYEQCHVLLAPSRAEGFGLPMAEAMLSNLAVITTGWGGQTDFCNDQTAWLIDYSFGRAQTHFGLFTTAWAEPDEQHLSALCKEVYATPQARRQKKIHEGQRLLRQRFTWKQVAQRMLRAAKACATATPVPEPRIGWVSTWNTHCGIASYSEALLRQFTSTVTVLAAEVADGLTKEEMAVRRCWLQGEDDPLFDLLDQIEQEQLDVIVIQFNYSFFNFDALAKCLNQLTQANRVVIMTLHTTTDPDTPPDKKLEQLAPALCRCARVLVHSHADLNRLKQMGLIDNVTLFPHGFFDNPLPLEKPKKQTDEFVLASYGFFLPQEGLLELIEALALLRSQGHNCRLIMANAQYPIESSADLIARARQRIEALGLEKHITICTDYLTDTDSLALLAKADLIVFPYQETCESSSAAVRFGVATSGRAVAVTPLPIFDDVKELVHYLPGKTASDIAKGITELADRSKNFEHSFVERQNMAKQWLTEHSDWRVGQRLQLMVQGLYGQHIRSTHSFAKNTAFRSQH